MICPLLIKECSETWLLEWQIRHYQQRLQEARHKHDNWQERCFLRKTLYGLKMSLASKLN